MIAERAIAGIIIYYYDYEQGGGYMGDRGQGLWDQMSARSVWGIRLFFPICTLIFS